MVEHISVPIKKVGSDRWGQLSTFGDSHLICGETVHPKDMGFSFAGGHRVRLYSFKKNVHWKIPAGAPVVAVDITDVSPADPPRRRQR
jgi:hypothetical protein